jgi:hypothetical protein
VKLYHFTCWHNYMEIVVAGEITTTESNIGSPYEDWLPFGDHVGPDVVWLTSHGEPAGNALEGLMIAVDDDGNVTDSWEETPPIEFDKSRLRITVELPDDEPQRWPDFSKRHRMNPKWRRDFEKGKRPATWWVLERPVRVDEIVEVVADNELAEYVKSRPPGQAPRLKGTDDDSRREARGGSPTPPTR